MSGNPYAPPTAKVSDVESGTPLARPRAVSHAILLFWMSVAIMVPLWFVEGDVDRSDPDVLAALIIGWILALVMLAVSIWVIVSIGRARNWARVTYTVIAALGWLIMISELPGMFAMPWYYWSGYLANAALDLAIVVLLFTPAANVWFRSRGRA